MLIALILLGHEVFVQTDKAGGQRLRGTAEAPRPLRNRAPAAGCYRIVDPITPRLPPPGVEPVFSERRPVIETGDFGSK